MLHYHWTSIHKLVYIIILRATWRTPLVGGVSRYIEDPLVAFGCCLLFGWVVVALTLPHFHSQFYSIKHVTLINSACICLVSVKIYWLTTFTGLSSFCFWVDPDDCKNILKKHLKDSCHSEVQFCQSLNNLKS